jgi:surface-adhesin protein E
MSESTDNPLEKNIVYGFSPDRSRWNNYAIDFDDTIYFYDTKSVLNKNNHIKVWTKFGEPVNDENGTRFYKEATALKEIDCGARLIRYMEWNYLSMKGDNKKFTSPTKWENIEPETADDALLEEVCTQPKKLKKR